MTDTLGPNATAVEDTLGALARLNRLSPADSALIAMVRSLAGAVDAAPANASLWREYHAALKALLEVGGDEDSDDARSLVADISTPR